MTIGRVPGIGSPLGAAMRRIERQIGLRWSGLGHPLVDRLIPIQPPLRI